MSCGQRLRGILVASDDPVGCYRLRLRPLCWQETDTVGCGLSSSAMAELALFQELHSYSTVTTGHSTLLVPLAVVMGTGEHITCASHRLSRRGAISILF